MQQNVTMLHRMVQQLGTGRDTSELRNQCQHQLQVVDELRAKIHAQVHTYVNVHTYVLHPYGVHTYIHALVDLSNFVTRSIRSSSVTKYDRWSISIRHTTRCLLVATHIYV